MAYSNERHTLRHQQGRASFESKPLKFSHHTFQRAGRVEQIASHHIRRDFPGPKHADQLFVSFKVASPSRFLDALKGEGRASGHRAIICPFSCTGLRASCCIHDGRGRRNLKCFTCKSRKRQLCLDCTLLLRFGGKGSCSSFHVAEFRATD